MAPMQRGFVHAIAWSLATGAAVTLSWWGVHTVMSGTAYDPPQALPIPTGLPDRADAARGAKPQASSTRRPGNDEDGKPSEPPRRSGSPSGSPAGPSGSPPPSRTPDKTGGPSGSASPAGPSAAANGRVKSYSTDGGRVTFDLGTASATLVSATPATGWSMQVWKDPSWIRVEFTAGTASVSVFCTWHDHPPAVEIVKS
ncbi:hypothetical protein AR457_22205 [Streptomyces agglomeratus]|uniref:Secreted protein n=2 Tax=Streptomyces agglomeratus TaxID=285458 RepID=A0A1E5PB19_9ACTN|nr:hypothetical protein AS594_22015 [Streptomyces agglomeratus]OEJ39178.1 hypothetical protein BGK70_14450 [Streptomyces agglomeratus]OEJ46438.1 hypothetical protein AR457_22205 [Streptomyces agglomeratus]OEJ51701.1 hypothetical protein BGK72_13890 [Streptomyces agglomeratus]OEJ59105.1 hypothetical protein BGM19_14995 [Streptomyces agglomeratus]